MEITGKIIQAFPEQSGTSRQGNPWHKREYLLETIETYPKRVFFNFFGDRATQYPLSVGQTIKLYFDIDSREYNGRWYVDIRAWKAEAAEAGAPVPPAEMQASAPSAAMPGGYGQMPPAAAPAPLADPFGGPDKPDNLPF